MIEITKSGLKIQSSDDFWSSLQVVLLKHNWPRNVLLYLADDKQKKQFFFKTDRDESHAWAPEYHRNLEVDFFFIFPINLNKAICNALSLIKQQY